MFKLPGIDVDLFQQFQQGFAAAGGFCAKQDALGLVLGGLLAIWLPLPLAIGIGGAGLPALLLLVSLGYTLAQASRSRG